MSEIIASTYELIQNEKIGSGGGGNIYLANHMRLGKKVVLKADKRKVTTRPELLRREVDVLKDLSHPYIPKVYDFFVENEIVYTVMDYIEGESLDKPLKRGEKYPQPQVIKWAMQMLEALSYLHSPTHGTPPRGYVHSDIKPANLMRTPNNDICLIDFNIALALGEANIIGCSAGYASPEHYGFDFSSDDYTTSSHKRAREKKETAVLSRASHERTKTLILSSPGEPEEYTRTLNLNTGKGVESLAPTSEKATSSSSSKVKIIVPDIRSDIYSVGATLYHLLSGRRPERNAKEVTPLSEEDFSSQIVRIISKAMNPNPDLRYQTAEEMLSAFAHLRENDIRTRRLKRNRRIALALFSCLFVIGLGLSFVGLKHIQTTEECLKLAEYSANALTEGDVSSAVELALQAIPLKKDLFHTPVTAEAQMALTNALGVYDLSDGFQALDAVKLPSAPFSITASPRGTRFAVVYAYETSVYDMETQQKIVCLPTQESALSDVVFVDEDTILYAGAQGVSAYNLDMQKELWTGEAATSLCLSADCKTAAAVNRDEETVRIYRVSDGAKTAERSFEGLHMSVAVNDIFADPGNSIFALNEDGSLLAVSFYNGGLVIFDIDNPDEDMILYEESDYQHFEGGFCKEYFAFSAEKRGESQFGLIDIAKAVYVGGYTSQDSILLHADRQGIYMANNNLLVQLDPVTLEETELAYTGNVNITAFSVGEKYVLAATDDNCFSFYDSGANLLSTENSSEKCVFTALTASHAILGNRDEPSLRLLEAEDFGSARLLSYDARYGHDEARISHDGEKAMLFNYQSFRIYDREGNLINQVQLPEAENIYDQQFVRGDQDSWLEVIWYDGTVRHYSAEDGSLLSEEKGEAPSKDLYEEFYIDGFRIASPLHGAPEVCSLESDKLVTVLEEDSYLTYVTQAGEYIVTEYISAEGERYGILLDNKFRKLAYLPGLSDVVGDMLIFDYKSGTLRQSRIYTLQELVALGETYLQDTRKEDFTR